MHQLGKPLPPEPKFKYSRLESTDELSESDILSCIHVSSRLLVSSQSFAIYRTVYQTHSFIPAIYRPSDAPVGKYWSWILKEI